MILSWAETGAPYYRVHKSLTPDGSFSELDILTPETSFVA
jgi:hypothetical protein